MKRYLRILSAGLALSGIAAPHLAAQAGNANPGAQFTGNFPAVSGKGVLEVVGAGYSHRQQYDDGEVPFLSELDSAGEPLPDGVYRFQFTPVPAGGPSSARQRDALRGGAVSPGGSSQISGTFEIQGGYLTFR